MRYVLFDIDGTLISSGGAGKAAMEAALAEEFGLAQLLGAVAMSGRTDRGIASDHFILHGIDDHEDNWRRLCAAYLQRLPVMLHEHRGGVLAGVAPLLEALQVRDDVTIGLLTGNHPEGARLKLEHYGLFDYFAFGAYGDRHGDRDEIARQARRWIGEHAGSTAEDAADHHVTVIGDTPLDVRCARAIGAQVIAVATGVHTRAQLATSSPDLLLDDLSDFAVVLRRLGLQ